MAKMMAQNEANQKDAHFVAPSSLDKTSTARKTALKQVEKQLAMAPN